VTAFVSFDLMKINLETGEKAGVGTPGSQGTQAWLSDPNGKPIARFDFGSISQTRQVFGYVDNRGAKKNRSVDQVLEDFRPAGIKDGRQSILVVERPPKSQYMA